MAKSSFEKRFSFELRSKESAKLLDKHPDRLPIIVEILENSNIPDIEKHKYLVPEETTCAQFMSILRRKMAITPETAIFMFVNNQLPPATETMGNLYAKHKGECGFLYVTISGESTFG
jgi:GABA(A) receptor-associated protein